MKGTARSSPKCGRYNINRLSNRGFCEIAPYLKRSSKNKFPRMNGRTRAISARSHLSDELRTQIELLEARQRHACAEHDEEEQVERAQTTRAEAIDAIAVRQQHRPYHDLWHGLPCSRAQGR